MFTISSIIGLLFNVTHSFSSKPVDCSVIETSSYLRLGKREGEQWKAEESTITRKKIWRKIPSCYPPERDKIEISIFKKINFKLFILIFLVTCLWLPDFGCTRICLVVDHAGITVEMRWTDRIFIAQKIWHFINMLLKILLKSMHLCAHTKWLTIILCKLI